jgi:hypothetical protein
MDRWKAVVAIATSTAAFAALVTSVGPARATIESIFSCAQSAPCLSWQNTTGGDAVKGVSANGSALHGQTKFNSSGQTAGKAGVLGEDLSTSGTMNAGVRGVSTNGAGVMGTSTSWNAVEGLSSSSTGAYGQTQSKDGFGFAGRNTASSAGQGAAILGDGGAKNLGVFALANAAQALYAYSASGTPLHLFQGGGNQNAELWVQGNSAVRDFIRATDILNNTVFSIASGGDLVVSSSRIGTLIQNAGGDYQNPSLVVRGGGAGSNFSVFGVYDNDFNEVFGVTDIGTLGINGQFYTNGPCRNGCLVGRKRVRQVTEYTPLASEPITEDFGHGTLVDGRADIAIDPRFANVIDSSKRYFVLLAPDGDCRGLYLAGESSQGFSVGELQGGHSNVAFEYRIIARRFGIDATRLPMAAVQQSKLVRRRTR